MSEGGTNSAYARGGSEIKFVADSNVGRLARWLRVLGYDTLFIDRTGDEALIKIALREGRVILTRDTGMVRSGLAVRGKPQIILVVAEEVRKQLRQVIQAVGIKQFPDQFTRCIECNEVLVMRRKEDVKQLVPPYVFMTQEHFRQCPKCNRLYWRGTHWQRMRNELESILSYTGGDA